MFRKFYKCGFCRISLQKISFWKLSLVDGMLALLGLRAHQCPHCFELQYRLRLPTGLPSREDEPHDAW